MCNLTSKFLVMSVVCRVEGGDRWGESIKCEKWQCIGEPKSDGDEAAESRG